MGIVYKAHDPEIDRPVAIKLILADLLDAADRDEFLARFRREARAAGRCIHVNIVAVYDLATHEGSPFIAMEYVDGKSLAQLLTGGVRFSLDQAVLIIDQILAALGSAHALGIVHRDVKPANILLTQDMRVKVTDFGVARMDLSDLTQTRTVLGTLSYMSPEQCRGDPVDGRADLFSVACILHELVLNGRPFPGRGEGEVINRLLNEPPAGLGDPNLSPALRDVIARGLAKLPGERFATADEMAAALRRAIAGTPADDDRTIIGAPIGSAPQVAPAAAAFEPDLLATLQRKLTPYVGPIAGRLVQSAARKASSIEDLFDTLAGGIGKQAERDRFLREAASAIPTGSRTAPGREKTAPGAAGATGDGGATPPGQSAPVPSETAQLAQRELTRILGPIAALLVRRTLPGAVSTEDLWLKLSAHIDSPRDRDAFLRTRP
jgi:serine/threonine-protein kinase